MTSTPDSWSRTEDAKRKRKVPFPSCWGGRRTAEAVPPSRPAPQDPTAPEPRLAWGRALQSASGERSLVSETAVLGKARPTPAASHNSARTPDPPTQPSERFVF